MFLESSLEYLEDLRVSHELEGLDEVHEDVRVEAVKGGLCDPETSVWYRLASLAWLLSLDDLFLSCR